MFTPPIIVPPPVAPVVPPPVATATPSVPVVAPVTTTPIAPVAPVKVGPTPPIKVATTPASGLGGNAVSGNAAVGNAAGNGGVTPDAMAGGKTEAKIDPKSGLSGMSNEDMFKFGAMGLKGLTDYMGVQETKKQNKIDNHMKKTAFNNAKIESDNKKKKTAAYNAQMANADTGQEYKPDKVQGI